MPQRQLIVWEFTAGDTAPHVLMTFRDRTSKAGVSIAGWTIKLVLRRPTTVLTKQAVITDATQGLAAIIWAPTDLVAGPSQPAEIQWTDALGYTRTQQRIIFNVRPDVAAP